MGAARVAVSLMMLPFFCLGYVWYMVRIWFGMGCIHATDHTDRLFD